MHNLNGEMLLFYYVNDFKRGLKNLPVKSNQTSLLATEKASLKIETSAYLNERSNMRIDESDLCLEALLSLTLCLISI